MKKTVFLLCLFVNLVGTTHLRAQPREPQQLLTEVLLDFAESGEWKVLYRESMISGLSIPGGLHQDVLLDEIKKVLEDRGLTLLVDEQARQLVIYRKRLQEPDRLRQIKGYIVDARTGERIPFATISWYEGEKLTGTVANQNGFFDHPVRATSLQALKLKVSSVGYDPLEISLTRVDGSVTLRLHPVISRGKEVVVNGFRPYSDLSGVQQTVDLATGNLAGEANTIKALQHLPSVSLGPAFVEGLNVRGSPADGFMVLLDDVTIYNQTHLFGLFDNFNEDALQKSGLYYGIIPASFQGATGGVLAMHTRTGSLNAPAYTAGISSTSFRFTGEGPLRKGRSSLLLSGRISLLDQMPWPGNSDLLSWGLNVDRPFRYLTEARELPGQSVIRSTNSNARFGDIHGTFNDEFKDGSRISIKGYLGYDDMGITAERLLSSFDTSVRTANVRTANSWTNGIISARYLREGAGGTHYRTTAGWSVFNTRFVKDDFTYTRINTQTGSLESFSSALDIRSVLNELVFKQHLSRSGKTWLAAAGFSYQYFEGEYFESSVDRPSFFNAQDAHKMDLYLSADINTGGWIRLNTGLRSHWYSQGNYFNLSPRLDIRLFPEATLQPGFGYSRIIQHVNRLSFSNVLSSDVWILADESNAPTTLDQLIAGLYWNKKFTSIHIEGYQKEFNHLRLHEIDLYALNNAFNQSPWFSGNQGRARGIEVLYSLNRSRLKTTQALTFSRVELWNEQINNGAPFIAEWDRRWQYTGMVEYELLQHLSFRLSQFFATGQPDRLQLFQQGPAGRLGNYNRTDVAVSYRVTTPATVIESSFGIYNVFNIRNPWYREIGFGIQGEGSTERFVNRPVEIFDLGFQPSFSVSVSF